MNKTLAYSLIAPLLEGQTTTYGWALSTVEVLFSDNLRNPHQVIYGFSTPRIKVILSPFAQGVNYASRTKNFGISVTTEEATFPSLGFKSFIETLKANDTGVYAAWEEQKAIIDKLSSVRDVQSVVYVVPGHIGNFYDLSFRAIRILRDVSVIFIEHGKRADLVEIDRLFGISLSTTTIVEFQEISKTELEYILTAQQNGENICLFGASEGLPTVSDPGWRLIAVLRTCKLPILTLAGGGALSTAIMRLGNDKPFLFWGGIHEVHQKQKFFVYLSSLSRESNQIVLPTIVCFVHPAMLKQHWPEWCAAFQNFRGNMRLMFDLSRPKEHEVGLPILAMSEYDIKAVSDKAKIVLVLEIQKRPVTKLWATFRQLLQRFRL